MNQSLNYSSVHHVGRKLVSFVTNNAITLPEYKLLIHIEARTVLADAKSEKAKFYIKDLSAELGYSTPSMIYRLLTSLEDKHLIVRTKTPSQGIQILGLNEEIFGQLLYMN